MGRQRARIAEAVVSNMDHHRHSLCRSLDVGLRHQHPFIQGEGGGLAGAATHEQAIDSLPQHEIAHGRNALQVDGTIAIHRREGRRHQAGQ